MVRLKASGENRFGRGDKTARWKPAGRGPSKRTSPCGASILTSRHRAPSLAMKGESGARLSRANAVDMRREPVVPIASSETCLDSSSHPPHDSNHSSGTSRFLSPERVELRQPEVRPINWPRRSGPKYRRVYVLRGPALCVCGHNCTYVVPNRSADMTAGYVRE